MVPGPNSRHERIERSVSKYPERNDNNEDQINVACRQRVGFRRYSPERQRRVFEQDVQQQWSRNHKQRIQCECSYEMPVQKLM